MKQIVVLSLLLITFLVNSSCKKSYYNDYLIPEGYVGWVRIIHDVKDAPPLPVEDGRTIFKFDESGVIKTSTPLQAGWVYPRYYYYNSESKELLSITDDDKNMIWYKVVSGGDVVRFFVGTADENSLCIESGCGDKQDISGYLPKNIKPCLEEYERTKKAGSSSEKPVK